MDKIGFVGLGDMGMGMARNLLKNGFEVTGFDLRKERLETLAADGGRAAPDLQALGAGVDAVFMMVLNGAQAIAVSEEVAPHLKKGGTLVVTATIKPSEVREVAAIAERHGLTTIDSPVSGGQAGANGGTLTLMTAAAADVLEKRRAALEAVSGSIFHVGEEIGMGQATKAALQAVVGTTYAGLFEALVLGAKAGVSAKVLNDVLGASVIGSPMVKNALRFVMERRFKGTGAQIGTMYKDLGITMAMAREVGTPMFGTAAAYELFQAGISMYPDEDNWTIVKVLEGIAKTEVR